VIVKGAAEQIGADGVAEDSPFIGLKFKIRIVRAELHRLAATVELKRPGSALDARLELELAREAGADRTDALVGFVPLAFGVKQGSVEAPDGDGRFVHHVHNNLNDVLIVVIDFHDHRRQVSVEGAGPGAVVIGHVGSPVPTEEWLYFNGLLQRSDISAVASVSPKAATSPRPQRCDAFGQQRCDIRRPWSRR